MEVFICVSYTSDYFPWFPLPPWNYSTLGWKTRKVIWANPQCQAWWHFISQERSQSHHLLVGLRESGLTLMTLFPSLCSGTMNLYVTMFSRGSSEIICTKCLAHGSYYFIPLPICYLEFPEKGVMVSLFLFFNILSGCWPWFFLILNPNLSSFRFVFFL